MSDTRSSPRPAVALLGLRDDPPPPLVERLPAGSPGDEEIDRAVGKRL